MAIISDKNFPIKLFELQLILIKSSNNICNLHQWGAKIVVPITDKTLHLEDLSWIHQKRNPRRKQKHKNKTEEDEEEVWRPNSCLVIDRWFVTSNQEVNTG